MTGLKMIDITAFIMGTCHPQRLAWLEESVDHLDSQQFPFVKKILAVDQFNGWTFPERLINKYTNAGWTLQIDSHRSRKHSMTLALEQVDSEYVFYNEEDVKANFPKIEHLEEVFNTKIDGKKCGMISMTLGGTQFDAASHFIGDLAHMEDDPILVTDEYLFFQRLEKYKSNYFFEFPGLFIRSTLFKDTHQIACSYSGAQIEFGLSQAWFAMAYNYHYFKASVAKRNALDILLAEPAKVNSHCRLLENLDPNQGSSPFGGVHNY